MAISSLWHIKSVLAEQSGSTSRVSLEIGGELLWFESDQAILEPSIEAFASVLLLPSLHHRVKLRLDQPVDARWLENVQRLCQIYRQWWGYNADFPIEAVAQPCDKPAAPAIGLCFTGGVDSFYSLLHYPKQVNRLIFAHGYDIPLRDLPRMEAYEKSLVEVAAKTGKSPIIIRTNLRSHPLFRTVIWDRTHGSGLAALGLLLSNEIGGLVIPPSYASRRLRPWGSHPETDPLFSSSRVQIFHHSTMDGRLERILAIANHDLVLSHLRVCTVNRTLTGNCSTCEKCVMTMAGLDVAGQLEHCQTLSHDQPVAARLNELNTMSHHLTELWWDIAAASKNSKLRSAIYRILILIKLRALAAKFKSLTARFQRS